MGKIEDNIIIDSKVGYTYQPSEPKNMPSLQGRIEFYYKDQKICIPERQLYENMEIKVVCDEMILVREDEKDIFTTTEPVELQLAFL